MSEAEHRDKSLQPDAILETITRLGRRIKERFPESSLAILCEELRGVSREAKKRAQEIRRPIIALRLASAVLVLLILAGVLATLFSLKKADATPSLTDFIQLLEAAINDVVLIGAGIFFLVTLESRIKRSRALKALHELRSFAHIIDMHQLTKDISRLEVTPSSPLRSMTAAELERYLDYCSEMLSLVGKVAALYIQDFSDGVAIASATEIENLTTGLCRKIWQKITLIESHLVSTAAAGAKDMAGSSAAPASKPPTGQPAPEATPAPAPETVRAPEAAPAITPALETVRAPEAAPAITPAPALETVRAPEAAPAATPAPEPVRAPEAAPAARPAPKLMSAPKEAPVAEAAASPETVSAPEPLVATGPAEAPQGPAGDDGTEA